MPSPSGSISSTVLVPTHSGTGSSGANDGRAAPDRRLQASWSEWNDLQAVAMSWTGAALAALNFFKVAWASRSGVTATATSSPPRRALELTPSPHPPGESARRLAR
jgi:hypothetical protein